MGSMANHPTLTADQNSVFYLITIDTEQYPKEILRHIPVSYAQSPITFDERYIYAMALVSTRDIQDEMVLLDYKFDGVYDKAPEWYTQHATQSKGREQMKADCREMVERTWEAGSPSF
eukprot:TRINITY_DN1065_c0_g1_i1.p2 TRINITY_DN1065_c0_g1~~TRINITY_DN1065_c0_g1_i1.p2  ORF type:complete len:118 (-),score=22.34 TRINITY_DN1065_c0_g1_i1:95-448(-)